MFSDTQSYIASLEKSGRLQRVGAMKSPDCAIVEYASSQPEGSAVLFENNGTRISVLSNIQFNETDIKDLFNVSSFEELKERVQNYFHESDFTDYCEQNRRRRLFSILREELKYLPKMHHGTAHCHESVQYKVSLSGVPFPKFSQSDIGFGLREAVIVSCDPDTGMNNVENIPVQILSESTIALVIPKDSNLENQISRSPYALPVAICLGGNPALHILSRINCDIDKFALLGIMSEKHLKMTSCLTQEIMVPADSDIVIEGYVHRSEARVTAGPMSNGLGADLITEDCPIMNVTCIAHRRDSVLPLYNCYSDIKSKRIQNQICEMVMAELLKKDIYKGIVKVSIPEGIKGIDILFVQLNKSNPEQSAILAERLWGTKLLSGNRYLIFVKDDIPLTDYEAVKKAIASRVNPDRDIYFRKGLFRKGAQLFGTRIMIDAVSGPEVHDRKFEDICQIDYGETPETSSFNIHDRLRALSSYTDIGKDCTISNGVLHIVATKK